MSACPMPERFAIRQGREGGREGGKVALVPIEWERGSSLIRPVADHHSPARRVCRDEDERAQRARRAAVDPRRGASLPLGASASARDPQCGSGDSGEGDRADPLGWAVSGPAR